MSDPLEAVIRPIVEGQLRGFVKEHPGVLNGVTWYKGKKHGQAATFVNSVAKRIVRDLLCEVNRARIEQAYFDIWEIEKSAVETYAAADGVDAGMDTGAASTSLVAPLTANEIGPVGSLPDRAGSHSLLPVVEWVRA